LAKARDTNANSDKQENVNGVEAKSILSHCSFFHPVTSTSIDYMHSLIGGVVKPLFHFWFSPKYSERAFSIHEHRQTINKRVKQIKLPSFVPTAPRSLYGYKEWRAHEYLAFILFYAQPVLREILPLDHYENLAKLVLFLEVILAPTILKDDLEIADLLITEFVSELSSLYQPSIMQSGVHELLHLCQCTLDFGHLHQTSCFQFEEINRKILNSVRGQNLPDDELPNEDLIGDDFIKLFFTAQCLCTFNKLPHDTQLSDYIRKHCNFGTSNRTSSLVSQSVYSTMGSIPTVSSDVSYLKAFEKETKQQVLSLELYDKLLVDNIVYTTNTNPAKNCDYCFVNNEGKIGLIFHFFKFQESFFAIYKRLHHVKSLEYEKKGKKLCSKISRCYIYNQEIFIECITNIRKVVLIKFEDAMYVSLFRTSHIFN
jgi:hypothetical protein